MVTENIIMLKTFIAFDQNKIIYDKKKVSVHLAKRFQRRRFFKIGQSETRIACGSHVCRVSKHPVQLIISLFILQTYI
jgi:hypothetical protein